MRRHAEHRMISHRYYLCLCRGVNWHKGCGTRTFSLSICAALGISCLNGCGLLWCGIIRWNTGPIISLWCIQAEMFTDIKRTCHMTIKGKKYEAFIYLDRCWLSKKLLRCPSLSWGDSENVQRHKAMISASKKQTLKWLSNQIISPRFKNKNSNIYDFFSKNWWDLNLRQLTN